MLPKFDTGATAKEKAAIEKASKSKKAQNPGAPAYGGRAPAYTTQQSLGGWPQSGPLGPAADRAQQEWVKKQQEEKKAEAAAAKAEAPTTHSGVNVSDPLVAKWDDKTGRIEYGDGTVSGAASKGKPTTASGMKQSEEQKKNRQSDLDAARVNARAKKGSAKGQFHEMTLDDYKDMSGQGRGAVDWNSTLREARVRDREALSNFKDRNNDGRITLDEVKNSKLPGYKTAYEKVFGPVEEGELIDYSPNVVALLNATGTSNSGGNVSEYTKGKTGFISDKELRKIEKGTLYDNEGPDGYVDPRATFVQNTSESMKKLNRTLAEGRVVLQGVGVKAGLRGTSRDERAAFVGELLGGLSNEDARVAYNMKGSGDSYNRDNGIDVSSLTRPGGENEIQRMNQVYQLIQYNQGNLDPTKDKSTLATLQKYNVDPKRWSKYTTYMTTGKEAGSSPWDDSIGEAADLAG